MEFNIFTLLKQFRPSWLIVHSSCLLCLARVKQSKLAICEGCLNDLPTIGQACSCCGLPIPYSGLCGHCLANPPYYSKVIAPYRYEFPIAQLISKFKYQGELTIGHLLADLLLTALQDNYLKGLAKPDYLLAVPLSKNRLKQRGFNQALLLAKWLANKLTMPVATDILYRVVDTPPQQSLTAKERHKNLKNAFELQHLDSIINKHLAIIDDVVTTGTTANTIASLLIKAGAKRVDVYAIARTPHTFK